MMDIHTGEKADGKEAGAGVELQHAVSDQG